MTTRVLFLAAHVKNYRLPFFEALHHSLQEDGIELRVLYGNPNSAHAARRDNVYLPSAYSCHRGSYWIADRLMVHSAWHEISSADLVITPNEHKLLLNPLLLVLRAAGAKRVAFWGKGDITPADFSKLPDWLRYKTANLVDWWFPYTDDSAENLRRCGVTCGITTLGNAIDTSELHRDMAGISDECLRGARYSLGIGRGPVGVFCGNLSANKHLDFLFTAGKLIHQQIPDFSLLVLGNGPLRDRVELTATRERFIRYLGPRIGAEKALLLKMSDVFLLPGAVGLAILDSFAAGLPLLTTDLPDHGPEISYLSNDVNGLITAHNLQAYAEATVRLLQDPQRSIRMRAAATAAGYEHSIENMVRNFRRGILECLAATSSRSSRVPISTV